MPRWSFIAVLATVLALLFATTASAHGGHGIELIAKDGPECANGDVCLELFNLPPRLEPGDPVSLILRNQANSSQPYAAALAPLDRADPDNEHTPMDKAMARTGNASPGETAHANLTTPDTRWAYGWLTGEDHEVRGGHTRIPIGVQTTQPGDAEAQAPASGALAAIAALAGIALARRR